MVQNVLQIVYKEVRGLHQAAYILALFTFGSQILALVRDRLLAHQFGAGIELDLYYTAFRIPDFLYVLFASTLSVYVLIPFIAERIEKKTYEDARYLLSQFFSLFVLVYAVIALVAMFFAPWIAEQLFPGFVEEKDTLVLLMRILLVQPLLLGISSLFGVVTQLEHRFVLYALSPLIYNLGIIGGLIFLYPLMGIAGIAVGVLVGAFGHVCIQIPMIVKSTLTPRFVWKFNFTDIIAVCKTSFTRAITLSLHQIVLLGFVSFASVMSIGSVSVFQFAYNLQSVPLAIIGVSYSVAAFPLLAQLYAEKKFEAMGKNIVTALRHIIFWAFPAIALFIVIRAQFVRVVLGSGEFDWNDTRLTAAVLALFIISLAAQAVHLLLVRALYAVGNTRIPFLVTLGSSMFALVSAFYFYTLLTHDGAMYAFMERIMRLEGVSGIEVLALPLGYSLALLLHSVALFILARSHIYIQGIGCIRPLAQATVASLFAGYVAYTTLNYFVTVFEADTALSLFMQGGLAGIGGIAGYILIQRLFRNTELEEIYTTLHRRFTKGHVVPPQDEDKLAV
jgi:putative peptidoglycan lipid II flippase